jgi:hypothetical protein
MTRVRACIPCQSSSISLAERPYVLNEDSLQGDWCQGDLCRRRRRSLQKVVCEVDASDKKVGLVEEVPSGTLLGDDGFGEDLPTQKLDLPKVLVLHHFNGQGELRGAGEVRTNTGNKREVRTDPRRTEIADFVFCTL